MFFYAVEKPPRLSEFDLEIPDKLIAKFPPKVRDNCKLMVLNKKEESIQHMKFSDIHQFFKKGDVLVMNNTKEKYILYEKSDIPNYNALKKELENFIESILNVKQPIINGYSGLQALKLAIKIQDSIIK